MGFAPGRWPRARVRSGSAGTREGGLWLDFSNFKSRLEKNRKEIEPYPFRKFQDQDRDPIQEKHLDRH
jgi:hypothetical protein